jgi:hypothetical protein
MKYMHNQLNGADGGITQKIFFFVELSTTT